MKFSKLFIFLAILLVIYFSTETHKNLNSAPAIDDFVEDSVSNTDLQNVLGTKSEYKKYDEKSFENDLAKSRVVLFFHDGDCLTCESADSDFEKNSANLPTDLIVLKVDFDKEKELRERFNATTKHTFILLVNGAEENRWVGGGFERLKVKI